MTAFDCNVTVRAAPVKGEVLIQIGPVAMNNIEELLRWLQTEAAHDMMIEHIAKAIIGPVG